MRQIEHAEWLSHNLINDVVVTAMKACTIKLSDAYDIGSSEITPFVIA